MKQNFIKESCVNSFSKARLAFQRGADRVELCNNLYEGGTTPSYGTIKTTIELSNQLNKDMVVMIRPRGGDFTYDINEFDIMKEDITVCKQLGVKQIITGILKGRDIDLEKMADLLAHASPIKVSFHMAFDELTDYDLGFQQLIDLKIQRVLTKGGCGAKTALEGKENIKKWIQKYQDCIEVLPGGGITYQNFDEFCAFTNSNQVHGTQIVDLH